MLLPISPSLCGKIQSFSTDPLAGNFKFTLTENMVGFLRSRHQLAGTELISKLVYLEGRVCFACAPFNFRQKNLVAMATAPKENYRLGVVVMTTN